MTHVNLKKLIEKMMEILSFAVIQEIRVDYTSIKLLASNSTSEETRRSLKPVIMYALCKIHKDIIDMTRFIDLFCQQVIILTINWQHF